MVCDVLLLVSTVWDVKVMVDGKFKVDFNGNVDVNGDGDGDSDHNSTKKKAKSNTGMVSTMKVVSRK